MCCAVAPHRIFAASCSSPWHSCRRFHTASGSFRAAANYELHKRIFDRIMADVAGYDLEKRLPAIKAATLLVWGDADRLVPPSALETFKRLIPNARPILLEGVGHVPQMEAIDRCATDYIAFRQSI